jgi:nucleoside-diphosphate-sugar epimerase
MQKIAIVGLGWLGAPLARHLSRTGWPVVGSVTREEKCRQLRQQGLDAHVWLADEQSNWPAALQADTLILNIPPGRTPDYVALVRHLCRQAEAVGFKRLLYVSSTSVYGGTGLMLEDQPVRPDSARGKEMLQCGIEDITLLRPAGLYGPARYPGRFLAGKSSVQGGQGVNLVHREDVIGIVEQILLQQAWGELFNVCAPGHPSRQAFYTLACELAGLPLPRFTDQLAEGKQIDGSKVCRVLGYAYQYPDPERWLYQQASADEGLGQSEELR